MKDNKTLALLGCDAPSRICESLASLGFKVILLPRDERLQLPVRSHADMLLGVIKNDIFCSEKYFIENRDIFNAIEAYGYTVTTCKAELSQKYPQDIAFNMLFVGNSIIGKIDFIAEEIKEYAQRNKIELLRVKQGYSKCSTLLLGDDAIICADDGIISEAERINLSTLKIENSHDAITLQGYGYGFIGGASGVFGKNVYFAGNIDLHPQVKKIAEFLTKFGFDAISLCEDKLCDVGGIIFLPPLL